MASLDFERERESFYRYYDSGVRGKKAFLRDAEIAFPDVIRKLLDLHGIPFHSVTSRLKDREECVRKFTIKYQQQLENAKTPYEIKEYITDLIGVRIVCLYETDISSIGLLLPKQFCVLGVTDKSLTIEDEVDRFGYKGLHLDLSLDKTRYGLPEYESFRDLRFEVQIRTIAQDAWSTLDHKIKYKKSIPSSLKRRINRLAALFEIADQEFLNIRNHTADLEKGAQEWFAGQTARDDGSLELDAFSFLTIAARTFPGYDFTPHKVDGFVEEIESFSPPLTVAELERVIHTHLQLLSEYREYQKSTKSRKLSPYTMIRHMLYQNDRERFHSALFNRQRENFAAWIKKEKPRAARS